MDTHSNLPPTLVIAGGASGVGKSVFSVGLMSTLRWALMLSRCVLRYYISKNKFDLHLWLCECRVKGLVVQAFKVGPGMPSAVVSRFALLVTSL